MNDLINDPWALFLAVSPHCHRVLLHSETPGTGKTTAGIMLAEAKQYACTVVTLSDSMTASDLLGHWVPQGGKFVWHDGPISRAVRRGNTVLVLNELDHAGPDVQHTLYSILETGRAAEFTLPNNETLRIPDSLVVVGTMNPQPSDALSPATLQRFQVVLDMGSRVSPMILDALPAYLRSMVKDGRMASREAFAIVELTGNGCPPMIAVQAILGNARCSDYGDALAIAIATGVAPDIASQDDSDSYDSDDSDSDDSDDYEEE
jgi:AAA domain (dynein-related subfamily)